MSSGHSRAAARGAGAALLLQQLCLLPTSAGALGLAATNGAAHSLGRLHRQATQTSASNCLSARAADAPDILNTVRLVNGEAVSRWQDFAGSNMTAVSDGNTSNTGAEKLGFVVFVGDTWPQEKTWRAWLHNVSPLKYRLVIHSYTGRYKPPPEFRGALMNRTVKTGWCRMMPAFLAAIREALADEAVQKLVFVCGMTVPVKPFNEAYGALLPEGRGQGMLMLSEMCTDEEWHRGMPWSYVLARRDARLFADGEHSLEALFRGVHTCDIEDWFVTAFQLASKPYSTSCVTWNGWTPLKGYSRATNGQHYQGLVASDAPPAESWVRRGRSTWNMLTNGSSGALYIPSNCGHPAEILRLPERLLEDMLTDPLLLFARKFPSNATVGGSPNSSGTAGAATAATPLHEYLTRRWTRPPPRGNVTAPPVKLRDEAFLWRRWRVAQLEHQRARDRDLAKYAVVMASVVLATVMALALALHTISMGGNNWLLALLASGGKGGGAECQPQHGRQQPQPQP